MASINITEEDFMVLAHAASLAQHHGFEEESLKLDKIARKINASLTNRSVTLANPFGRQLTPVSWRDMPSTLG